jgi:hypothetical protein
MEISAGYSPPKPVHSVTGKSREFWDFALVSSGFKLNDWSNRCWVAGTCPYSSDLVGVIWFRDGRPCEGRRRLSPPWMVKSTSTREDSTSMRTSRGILIGINNFQRRHR